VGGWVVTPESTTERQINARADVTTTTTVKDVGLPWLTSLCSDDAETAISLMADDFRYCLPGTSPTAGWWDRDGFFAVAQMLPPFLAGPLTMRIGEVTAEEDRVWIEAESEALSRRAEPTPTVTFSRSRSGTRRLWR
jgi:hypothetical protein